MPPYLINPAYANVGPNAGLIQTIEMDQTGVPADGQSGFAPLAVVFNIVDDLWYVNNGDSSATVWAVVPSTVPSSFTLTKKVSLTSAQILALNTTPIELIAAPGSGKVIQVISVYGRINFLTAAYATHTAIDIVDETTGNILAADASALLAATSTKVSTIPLNANSGVGVIVTANGGVAAKVATGDPATGAGSLDIYISYKVITL